MRPKSLILLALALGCGLVASIGISQVMESRRAQQSSSEEKTEILVALDNIERNTELSPKNAGMKPWPKDQVPEGAVTKIEEIVGHRPNARIVKGEAILQSKLGGGEGNVRATNEIPADYRVVSVKVDPTSGGGLLLPGDRVDLQVFINKGPNVTEAGTWTFLHDVSVFAVNSEIRHDPNSDAKIDAKIVSLLVTSEQAAKVTLAAEVGTIRMVMRGSHADKEGADAGSVSLKSLFGGSEHAGKEAEKTGGDMKDFLDQQAKKPVEPTVDKPIHTMVVVSGSETHMEEFHKGELMPRRINLENNGTHAGGGDSGTNVINPAPPSDPIAPLKGAAPAAGGAKTPAPLAPSASGAARD